MKLSIAQQEVIRISTNSPQEMMILESRIQAQCKDKTVAYVIGFFLGAFGVHRMYCGQIGLGILQAVLSIFFLVGLIWVLADVVLTSALVDKVNDQIVKDTIYEWNLLNR